MGDICSDNYRRVNTNEAQEEGSTASSRRVYELMRQIQDLRYKDFMVLSELFDMDPGVMMSLADKYISKSKPQNTR